MTESSSTSSTTNATSAPVAEGRRVHRPIKLAILTSHPIQYQAPLFRAIARRPDIDLTVLFCHDHGVRLSYDAEFGREIQFDVPLLEGYRHEFLRNLHPRPTPDPKRLINPGIASALLGNRFDALVVHGYTSPTALWGLVGPRRKTKVLLRGESNLVRPRSGPLRALKQVFLRSVFSRVDHFLAIGTLNAAYYRAYGVASERVSLAPYTVDDTQFAAPPARDPEAQRALRRSLGLPEHGLLCLFVAKLIPRKRPQDLVRAIASMPADLGVTAVLVGVGELMSSLQEEIEAKGLADRVHLLGFRNQSELPALYRSADVMVLPSGFDTWGLVVNEAMAAGAVPVVTSQVGSGPDLVDPSCIYEVGDVPKLTQILARLATDLAWLEQQRRGARSRIDGWRLEDTAESIVAAVRRLHRGPS